MKHNKYTILEWRDTRAAWSVPWKRVERIWGLDIVSWINEVPNTQAQAYIYYNTIKQRSQLILEIYDNLTDTEFQQIQKACVLN
jgi:hypothetical protein